MTHTYNITGMTCMGCVAKVTGLLQNIPGVSAAEVKLDAQQATITMNNHIATDALQQALGNGKYTITDTVASMPASVNVEAKEEGDSYYPIFLIFGYIAGVTLLAQYTRGSFSPTGWMSSFMAGFFIVFSFFKLLNLKGFTEGYVTYDIVAKAVPSYAYVYPFVELALGIAYLTAFQPLVTNIVTAIVMGISTIGVIQSLMRKTTFQCACLGTIIKLPLSKVTLFEDVLMVAMSVAMIIMQIH